MNSSLLLIFGLVFLASCSHMSNLPDEDNVTISREDAKANCTFLGKLEGRSLSKVPKPEDALNDLKMEAVNKGANYLTVKEYSANRTAVTGLAYKCP